MRGPDDEGFFYGIQSSGWVSGDSLSLESGKERNSPLPMKMGVYRWSLPWSKFITTGQ